MWQPLKRLRSSFIAGQGRGELKGLHRDLAACLTDAEQQREDLCFLIVEHVLEDIEEPPKQLVHSLINLAYELIDFEGVYEPFDVATSSSLGDVWSVASHLQNRLRFFKDETVFNTFTHACILLMREAVTALPSDLLFAERDEGGLTLQTPVETFIERPGRLVEELIGIANADEVTETDTLINLRHILKNNLYRTSNIDPEELEYKRGYEIRKRLVMPSDAKEQPGELIRSYLRDTPFQDFLSGDVPFAIPSKPRFEHMHVVGGTGHGKTQLLQQFMLHDLEKVRRGEASLCVIDSQGDMLNTIMHLKEFDPHDENSLAKRLVLIDPNDIMHPPCLNLFDFGLDRLDRYSALDREKILNAAVAQYEYMFGALLGADLTQRQTVIFRYLARLMMAVPGATIHTLRDFMEEPESVAPYFEKLDGSTRHFFEREFLDKKFDDTRQQIRTRLWGVLSNSVLERMFSNAKNKVNLFDAFNDGSVVLINTAKDLLKEDGCQILGRFFISLIAQAAQERASIHASQRLPTFVYVDEAQDYFDASVEVLLSQARKYGFGLIMAHQNLNQFERSLLASVTASTSIKLAGGVSSKDAEAFSKEMRCEPEFIRDMRKRGRHTEFACWVKNMTERPIKLTVPFGAMEKRPKLEREQFQLLIQANRGRYSATIDDVTEQNQAEQSQPHKNKEGFELGEWEEL